MQRKLNKELITGSHNLVRARRNILFKVLQYSLAMLRVTEFQRWKRAEKSQLKLLIFSCPRKTGSMKTHIGRWLKNQNSDLLYFCVLSTVPCDFYMLLKVQYFFSGESTCVTIMKVYDFKSHILCLPPNYFNQSPGH